MTKLKQFVRGPPVKGFSRQVVSFRVTIAAYAIANASLPVSPGIDHDGRGLGAAGSIAFGRASGQSTREEITGTFAAACEAKERRRRGAASEFCS